MQTIILPQPPTTNKIVSSNRSNKFVGAKLKKQWTNVIASYCEDLTPYTGSIWVAVDITYPRANCDPDNLFGCLKFIFDGLVKAGVIKNDSAKYIKSPTYFMHTKHPERTVTLYLFDDISEYREFIVNHASNDL